MSNISSNGLLRIDRGDTFSFFYPINIGTELYPTYYELTENDKLYFAVMEPGQSFENALIKKVYSNTDMVDDGVDIRFKSTDTLYLFPGQYYYSIKLRTNIGTENENIITLVTDRICWIQGNIPSEEELEMNLYTQLNELENKVSSIEEDISNINNNKNLEQDTSIESNDLEINKLSEDLEGSINTYADNLNDINETLESLIN